MLIILYTLSLLMIVATILPFTNIKKWWGRDLDFPRLQIFFISFFLIILFAVTEDIQKIEISLTIIILILLILYQVYQILPYTIFYKKQVRDHDPSEPHELVSLITMNVKKENRNPKKCISLIKKNNPDIVLLVEIDNWWVSHTEEIQSMYDYQVIYPLDNNYGMMLLSKLKITRSEIKFLVEDSVPSIHTTVLTSRENSINLICLHPIPPTPSGNKSASKDSSARDIELSIVAKGLKSPKVPTIVLGDLNDVAWSETTRKFQAESQLLDPRQGRGLYNTFHAKYFFLRFPLDHIFSSYHFQCKGLKRLEFVHSDHFPIFVQLSMRLNSDA